MGLDGDLARDVIYLAPAILALATAGLMAWRALTGTGPALLGLIANLFAGVFLLLVAREALGVAGGVAVVACLTGALITHAAELATRCQRAPQISGPALSRAAAGPHGAKSA